MGRNVIFISDFLLFGLEDMREEEQILISTIDEEGLERIEKDLRSFRREEVEREVTLSVSPPYTYKETVMRVFYSREFSFEGKTAVGEWHMVIWDERH